LTITISRNKKDISSANAPRVAEPRLSGIPACYFFSEGLAAVEVDGKVGFIDKDGRMILAPRWPAYAP
jgi:hypothetical protein